MDKKFDLRNSTYHITSAGQKWKGNGRSGQVPFLLAEPPRYSGGRSMRAVKARLATPWREVVRVCQKRRKEEMVAGTALSSLPTPRLEISASGTEMVPESVFPAPGELSYFKVRGQAMTPAAHAASAPFVTHLVTHLL